MKSPRSLPFFKVDVQFRNVMSIYVDHRVNVTVKYVNGLHFYLFTPYI